MRYSLNFDNGPKWYSETRQTGIKIFVESKLLVLVLSNMAYDDVQDFHFFIQEFTNNFYFKFGVDNLLNFDIESKMPSNVA